MFQYWIFTNLNNSLKSLYRFNVCMANESRRKPAQKRTQNTLNAMYDDLTHAIRYCNRHQSLLRFLKVWHFVWCVQKKSVHRTNKNTHITHSYDGRTSISFLLCERKASKSYKSYIAISMIYFFIVMFITTKCACKFETRAIEWAGNEIEEFFHSWFLNNFASNI